MGRSIAAAAAAAVMTAALAISFAGPESAHAHGYKLGDLAVGHIWAKPPENGADGVAVYVPFLNSGKTSVELVGATAPVGEQVRLRKVAKDGTVTWPKAVTIKPGKPYALAAWREHLWVSGLKKPLKDGDTFELTLDFGHAGKLPVEVLVEAQPGH